MTTSGVLGYSKHHTMKLVIKDSSSIRKKVYHHLREQILRGEIAPHERLIETRIAREIGTSRTPVREALHSLELEKLIRSVPRVGYVVEGLSSLEMEQICEIRGVIEGLAARWALEKGRLKLIADLKKLLARQEKEISVDNLVGYAELDGQFHEAIAKASGSERLLELSQTLRRYMLRYRIQCIYEKETAIRSIFGHRAIVSALEANDREAASLAIQDHLDQAKRDILYFVFTSKTGSTKKKA